MNIHAKKGDKVIVTEFSAKQGYEVDKEKVKQFLEINKVYTITCANIYAWHTDVFLEETGDISFNSVNFEDFQESSKEKIFVPFDYWNDDGTDSEENKRIKSANKMIDVWNHMVDNVDDERMMLIMTPFFDILRQLLSIKPMYQEDIERITKELKRKHDERIRNENNKITSECKKI